MGLRAVFAEALPDVFSEAGEEALFTPAIGAAIPCHVFIDFNVKLQPGGTTGQIFAQGTTIEALLSEIGREPNRDETFTVDGIVYKVKSPLENDKLTVKVVVT
ncbi:MAG: hypothetical protein M0P74_00790 [Syntrophales bacterium]|jgi:hypothetical protein|nr:hypothetical protein [Syntrophales bacterium]